MMIAPLLLAATGTMLMPVVAAGPPVGLSPINGAMVYCGRGGATPTFTFASGMPVPKAIDGLPDTLVEISTSSGFDAAEAVVHTDHVAAILERYVRAEPLPFTAASARDGAAKSTVYWWRVGRPHNSTSTRAARGAEPTVHVVWSEPASFTAMVPAAQGSIPETHVGWQAIQSALARAATSPVPYLLEFPTFDRTLAPPPRGGSGSSSDAPFFINMSDVVDVIIDGGGSVITFSRYTAYVQLVNCTRVTIQNFVFDLAPLPYTALAIDAVNAAAMSVTAILLPDHPTLEYLTSAMSPSAASDAKAGLYSVAGPGGSPGTKRGVPELVEYSNVTRVAANETGSGSGVVRYSMGMKWAGLKQPRLDGVAVGDVIVVDPRIDAGLRVWGGEQVTLRSVLVRSCPNECFSSVHASSLAILGCGTVLVPGRFLAANNGGHNHHGARTGQWVEGGTWENAGDDTIHVSGLVLSPIGYGPAGSSQLLLGSNEPITAAPEFRRVSFVQVGDLLQFWDSQSGGMLARRTVTAVEAPTERQHLALVTLDTPVGPIVFGHGNANHSVTQVYSFNCTSNQFVFRKNRVRNGRRVGVLYKGYRSWIDSNSFEGLGGGALEMWNAPIEGLWAHSVLFRKDTRLLCFIFFLSLYSTAASHNLYARLHCGCSTGLTH